MGKDAGYMEGENMSCPAQWPVCVCKMMRQNRLRITGQQAGYVREAGCMAGNIRK
jgi:hypothetical protein